MKPFYSAGGPIGFPRGTLYTPVPNPVFGPLLEDVEDTAELKCTLRALWLLHQKKKLPRYLTEGELVNDKVLLAGLKHLDIPPADAIRRGIKRGVERGTFLSMFATSHQGSDESEGREELYLLNDEGGRKSLNMLKRGEYDMMPSTSEEGAVDGPPEPKATIFTLYEENIGMLTPLLAEEMKEAEASYPWPWIEEVFKIAVSRNKRNWRYIETILRRWATEGKNNGEFGGHSQKVPSEEDLFEYFRKRGRPPGS